MDRRKFTRTLSTGLLTPLWVTAPSHLRKKKVKIIRPPRLNRGDVVGLIAPASGIRDGQLDRAVTQIKEMGYEVKIGRHASDQNGFLAGLDHERIQDFKNMMRDDTVKAVWCIRGGYGLSRIASDLQTKLLFRNPKIIIGYSDVTVLHNVAATFGLATLHAQVAGAAFNEYVKNQLQAILKGQIKGQIIQPKESDVAFTINAGKVSGPLTGGNLSLLAAMAGTPYLDRFKNKIVFIEDVGEKPYRIDRMLTQLIQASDLSKAKGILLGNFADCEKDEKDNSWTLKEVLYDRLQPLNIPTCYGIPFGHVDDNFAMPMLTKVTMDADAITMTYDEEFVA